MSDRLRGDFLVLRERRLARGRASPHWRTTCFDSGEVKRPVDVVGGGLTYSDGKSNWTWIARLEAAAGIDTGERDEGGVIIKCRRCKEETLSSFEAVICDIVRTASLFPRRLDDASAQHGRTV